MPGMDDMPESVLLYPDQVIIKRETLALLWKEFLSHANYPGYTWCVKEAVKEEIEGVL